MTDHPPLRLTQRADGVGSYIADQAAVSPAGTPSPPTQVAASALAYRDANGRDFVGATVTWVEPSTQTDGTPCFDLLDYQVQYQVNGGAWTGTQVVPAGGPLASYPAMQPGTTVIWRVAAVNTSGKVSVYASSAPVLMPKYLNGLNAPSVPTLSSHNGALAVKWDGLDLAGAVYDSSWLRCDVHVSSDSTFTPSPATLYGAVTTPGGGMNVLGLSYASTFYAKLVAIDRSLNPSVPSAPSAGLNPAQVGDADISAVGVDKLTTGVLQAGVRVIAGTDGAARTEMSPDGLTSYDANNVAVMQLLGGSAYFSGHIIGTRIDGSAAQPSVLDGCTYLCDDSGGNLLVYLIGTTAVPGSPFSTSGAGTYTVAQTGYLKVECWGGGGGGSSGMIQGFRVQPDKTLRTAGPGGGGGEHAQQTMACTAGDVCHYTVGPAGAGDFSSNGGAAATAGGDTSFTGTSTVTAHGGQPGYLSYGPQLQGYAGAGGTGSSAPIHYSGGAGGASGTVLAGSPNAAAGGGGRHQRRVRRGGPGRRQGRHGAERRPGRHGAGCGRVGRPGQWRQAAGTAARRPAPGRSVTAAAPPSVRCPVAAAAEEVPPGSPRATAAPAPAARSSCP